MCGRYALTADSGQIAQWFDLEEPPMVSVRYNVAPSQLVAVVGLKPGGLRRGLVLMRWGFVPRWSKDPNSGPKPINAKSETIATNAAFRTSFRDRRCLIPMTGFYEWDRREGKKQPYHFRTLPEPTAFASIWDLWYGPTEPLYTCAIITVAANDVVEPYHDRMPAILRKDHFDTWLCTTATVGELQSLLRPFPADELGSRAVSPTVNSAKNDGLECLESASLF